MKRLAAVILLLLCVTSCSEKKSSPALKDQLDLCGKSKEDLADENGNRETYYKTHLLTDYDTPTREVTGIEIPFFEDDLEFDGMSKAIDRQLAYFKKRPPSGKISLGGKIYSLSKAPRSLEKMRSLISRYKSCLKNGSAKVTCLQKMNEDIRKYFVVVKPELAPDDPRFGEDKQTLFTGYYTPVMHGTEEATSQNPHAIYLRPSSETDVSQPRLNIDFRDKLKNKDLEIIHINELFAAYLLHVQGSGKAIVNTSRGRHEFYMGYAGTNGQPWNFISKYMAQKGYINDGSIATQRRFLNQNPDKQEEVFATCPSYVYFLKTNQAPLGSGNVSVTPNRSIATDTKYYKFKGLLAYVSAARPKDESSNKDLCKTVEFAPFSRFYLDQDTGGAIRGKARVDLYFGEDEYAEVAAFNTVQRGDLYFLMLR